MRKVLAVASILALSAAAPANAALTVFQTFTGNYAISSDGAGSLSAANTVNATVPAGATVIAAYLYQSNQNTGGNQPVSLNGNALSFSTNVVNTSATFLNSSRADVTSIVAPVINGGAGGVYNFAVNEGNTNGTDGTALVVVYQLGSLPVSTVAILDGFSAVGGDTATLGFSSPLNPLAPGFAAEMRLGIGFSCCNQSSNVTVNGTTITNVAGNFDDGAQSSNGSLITVGGDDDPFSTLLPTYANDHERYNLVPYINPGDTSITIRTNNPTADDNIFLALFQVTGIASVTTSGVPEPSTWAMMLLGFGAIGMTVRRRRKVEATQTA
jgi:hypothetical protein